MSKRPMSSIRAMAQETDKILTKENESKQILDKEIQQELELMKIVNVPINELYSAPPSWNQWDKIPEEKLIQLCQSIVDVGQQAPCILWQVKKEGIIKTLYENDSENNNDDYNFTGNNYMILSGHNRAYARKLISETEDCKGDEKYQYVPAFIYTENPSENFIEKAKQIIDDTNFLSREKTTKETMAAIIRKEEMYKKNGGKRHNINIAETIAESLNISKKQVQRYSKINNELLDELKNMMLEQKISFNDALKLVEYPLKIQQFLYNKHPQWFFDKQELKKFIKKTSPNMLIEQIEEIMGSSDVKQINTYEDVVIKVPKKHLEEFNDMIKKWHDEINEKTINEENL